MAPLAAVAFQLPVAACPWAVAGQALLAACKVAFPPVPVAAWVAGQLVGLWDWSCLGLQRLDPDIAWEGHQDCLLACRNPPALKLQWGWLKSIAARQGLGLQQLA